MPELEEIVPGVHRWTVEHPEWDESQGGAQGWAATVSCVAYEGDGALILVDPLVPDGDWASIDGLVERNPTHVAIAVTGGWHRRSAGEAQARYVNLAERVTTHAHAATAKSVDFEVTQAAESAADLPGGVQALVTDEPQGEITLWLERVGTVVAGDVLLGAEGARTEPLRVCPEEWLEGNSTVEDIKAALSPLLEREVRAIVPLHGAPITSGAHEALQRALA